MDKVFSRNFFIFMTILLICVGTLVINLIEGDKKLQKIDLKVKHTQNVIIEAEQVSTFIEGMLASQRGYLLTGEAIFLESYKDKKAAVSENIARLSELTIDNPSQQSRLNEIQNYITVFAQKLEERAAEYTPQQALTQLDDYTVIKGLRDDISRINKAVLSEEYDLLNQRIQIVDLKRSEYLTTLMIGLVVGTALLLVFNGFLLHTQRKKSRAERDLKDTEDRFALAIDGTNDGIFDWDLKTDEVFYSANFFSMLGYEKKSFKGGLDEFKDLLHPDDIDTVWQNVDDYLAGKSEHYKQEFRMKSNDGRWVWVQARAKALYDNKNKPYRMIGAHTDVTSMIKRQEELENEKKDAVDASRAKSEFLAHMSHEIRTPLTAISGIAEILERKKDNLDDKQKQLLNTLSNSTSALKDLINDILDFSRIESREIELEDEFFPLDVLIEQLISMMSLRASEKGISFVFNYEDVKEKEFLGDQIRVRQILTNLIGNAIKFTEKGGVTIKAYEEIRDELPFLRIDVSDTGIGIAPENFDLVFEKFKQADPSVSRKFGGTGLGLPISLNLAELMGGDIILSSETGKGSTFSLMLPIKDTKVANVADISESKQKHLNEKIKSNITENDRFLMAEDYEGNIVMLSYLLEDLGIEFDVAKTGKEAVKLWEKNSYNVILMDIQMPEMDGFTATEKIREIENKKKMKRTPIIGMTAHALVGDKDKCIAAGMDSYLPKPIVESDLKKEILRFITLKEKAA